ncbi:MAG: alpha/beta fold hydrolase [Solirubrobacterales bacterium]
MSASEQIAVERFGSGPAVLFLHGGVGPELTWDRQMELAQRWSLIIPIRRGFPRSAPARRQDFEADAEDVARLLTKRTHLVGFSYGGLGVTLAAERDPRVVRSLTLIETPLYLAAPGHPAVREIAEAGDAFLSGQADELTEREFLAKAGIEPPASSGRTAEQIREAIDAARGGRSPSEARPDLDGLARAGIPVMVVSGGHHDGIEALCDGLAERLGARREIVSGAGHAVPRATGFNDVLEDFLRGSAGTGRLRTA